ncbi:hypothetical protein [Cyclobacterium lianum]|uniref:hypothetical protein n=1 Tax=Cyclobacterium lianum TaxID=388280 RepID=UPI00116064BB|nr:hypothetical protein [Cyclobacterium lianum]
MFLSFFIILFVSYKRCGQVEPLYTHFSGETSALKVLSGQEVMLLYPKEDYKVDSLEIMLETYDNAYMLAVEISGREPLPPPQKTDKLPVAIVPSSCGRGCGRIGRKGIEITKAKFDLIYREFVVNGRHDHLFFYELGRNFWFYVEDSADLEWEAIRTGFAVFLRDLLIRELSLKVTSINGVPYMRYMEGKQSRWMQLIRNRKFIEFTWEEIQPIKEKLFPHASLFWSMLWWDIYQKRGKKGVISVMDMSREKLLSGNGEAWFTFLLGFQ